MSGATPHHYLSHRFNLDPVPTVSPFSSSTNRNTRTLSAAVVSKNLSPRTVKSHSQSVECPTTEMFFPKREKNATLERRNTEQTRSGSMNGFSNEYSGSYFSRSASTNSKLSMNTRDCSTSTDSDSSTPFNWLLNRRTRIMRLEEDVENLKRELAIAHASNAAAWVYAGLGFHTPRDDYPMTLRVLMNSSGIDLTQSGSKSQIYRSTALRSAMNSNPTAWRELIQLKTFPNGTQLCDAIRSMHAALRAVIAASVAAYQAAPEYLSDDIAGSSLLESAVLLSSDNIQSNQSENSHVQVVHERTTAPSRRYLESCDEWLARLLAQLCVQVSQLLHEDILAFDVSLAESGLFPGTGEQISELGLPAMPPLLWGYLRQVFALHKRPMGDVFERFQDRLPPTIKKMQDILTKANKECDGGDVETSDSPCSAAIAAAMKVLGQFDSERMGRPLDLSSIANSLYMLHLFAYASDPRAYLLPSAGEIVPFCADTCRVVCHGRPDIDGCNCGGRGVACDVARERESVLVLCPGLLFATTRLPPGASHDLPPDTMGGEEDSCTICVIPCLVQRMTKRRAHPPMLMPPASTCGSKTFVSSPPPQSSTMAHMELQTTGKMSPIIEDDNMSSTSPVSVKSIESFASVVTNRSEAASSCFEETLPQEYASQRAPLSASSNGTSITSQPPMSDQQDEIGYNEDNNLELISDDLWIVANADRLEDLRSTDSPFVEDLELVLSRVSSRVSDPSMLTGEILRSPQSEDGWMM